MTRLPKITRESLSDQVYRILQTSIITGDLSPGERLRDQEVAARLGVSRTPVREALQRLEEEGLVETVPGSLTRVTPATTREAWDTFPVVAALHALATRLAAGRLTAGQFDAMRAANAALKASLETDDTPGAIEADDQFHAVILQAAGNSAIIQALDRLMPRIRRLEYAKFGSLEGRNSCTQHEAIALALEHGAGQAAAHLVEENWLSLERYLTRVLTPNE